MYRQQAHPLAWKPGLLPMQMHPSADRVYEHSQQPQLPCKEPGLLPVKMAAAVASRQVRMVRERGEEGGHTVLLKKNETLRGGGKSGASFYFDKMGFTN